MGLSEKYLTIGGGIYPGVGSALLGSVTRSPIVWIGIVVRVKGNDNGVGRNLYSIPKVYHGKECMENHR